MFASRLRLEAAPARAALPDDRLFTSAKKIAELIRTKKLSSVEVTQAYIARIEAVNPKINAVVFPCFERALEEAARADAALAKGKNFRALHGVPCTMKDSHDTLGLLSTGGTRGRKGRIASRDATYVQRVRAAGAIILGKTNTPELTELLEKQDANRSRLLGWMKNYDIVINPVMPKPAQLLNAGEQPPSKPGSSYMGVHNTSGYPSAVVRAGTSPEGLPIGVQIIGQPWAEDKVLAAAAFIEGRTSGWSKPAI